MSAVDHDAETTEVARILDGSPPWTLAPGEATTVRVTHTPTDELPDTWAVTVTSDAPVDPIQVARFEATGALSGEGTDIFQVEALDQVDVLFAVDRSAGMADHLTELSAHMTDLVGAMAAAGVDYQVSVTVEDSGCVNGSALFIDASTPTASIEGIVEDMVQLGGSYGSNTERAFMLMESALASAGSGDCNDGLIRDDAGLALVGVSDEAEQSVHPYTDHVTLFQSLKDDPDDVVVFGIGGDHPSGCTDADFYAGIYEASVATGGSLHSICTSDWATTLALLGTDVAAVGGTASNGVFSLSQYPVSDTLDVSVDGAPVSAGWVYDPVGNGVVFDVPSRPGDGSVVVISYALMGDCDE